jgi:hypothetical protein
VLVASCWLNWSRQRRSFQWQSSSEAAAAQSIFARGKIQF